MSGVGEALGAVALVVGIKGAFDTYIFLGDLFHDDEDAHSLVLRYKTYNLSLQRWMEKLDEMIAARNDPISPLAPEVKKLLIGHLTEIDHCNAELDKCLDSQGIGELPAYERPLDGQSLGTYVTSEENKRKWKEFQPKRRKAFKLKHKEKFRKNLEKLGQSVQSLESILENVVAIENTATALATLLASKLESSLELGIVAESGAIYGHLAASVARLKLTETSPSKFFAAPQLPPSAIQLDDDNTNGPRSMGFYNDRRVLIEWKSIGADLDDQQRDKIIERVEALGALLFQQKEPEFRVPLCLGIYTSSLLQKGFVYQLPSSKSEKFNYYSLADRLEPIRVTGKDGKPKYRPATVPLLGDRFRLAYILAKAFNLLHGSNWLHKDFRSCNVVFFDRDGQQPNSETIAVNEMYVMGFQYSRPGTPGEPSIETQPQSNDIGIEIYRHPDVAKGYQKLYDLYSLGVVLFEIAIWEPLKSRPGVRNYGANAEARRKWLIDAVDVLGGRVGAAYRDVVRACLTGDFGPNVNVDKDLDRAVLFKVVDPLFSCKA